MAIVQNITLTDGTWCEDVIDLDINGSSLYITYTQYILTLTDATLGSFTVGGDITTDGAGSGIGVIREITGNDVAVDITSGTFAAADDVDDANPFAAAVTSVVSDTKAIKTNRVTYVSDANIGTYL